MLNYLYKVNTTKVKVIRWGESHKKYLVEKSDGTRQWVAENLLKITDEVVPENWENVR